MDLFCILCVAIADPDNKLRSCHGVEIFRVLCQGSDGFSFCIYIFALTKRSCTAPAWLHFCHHFHHTWLSQVVIVVCSSSAFSLHQYLMHRRTQICALSWFSLHEHCRSYFDVRTQAMLVTQDRFTVRYIWSSIHPLSWFSHYISLCTLELRSCSPPFAIYLGSPCINIILHI